MKFGLLILLIALVSNAAAQTVDQKSSGSLAERIHSGDASAVLEMGRSDGAEALPLLLSLFHDPDYGLKREVRLALAKLGERESRQYIACRSLTTSQSQIENLINEDLDYIGGDFTIEIYRQLLDSDERFAADMDRTDRNSDALLTFPSSTAMLRLSKLIPDAEIPNPSPLAVQAGKDRNIKIRWAAWIDEHKEELQELKPTTEGIIFDSSYCSDFTYASALDRRLHTIAGTGATNCGDVEAETNSSAVDKCVRNAVTTKKAFIARFDVHDSDHDIAVGLASAGQGDVYGLAFDDAGVSALGLGDNAELFDDRHTVVVPCPKPIQFRQSVFKGLTCVNQKGNRLLSPE